MTALKHFRHRGHEVVVMQFRSAGESVAFDGDAIFKDLETQEELMTQPWHIQKAYQPVDGSSFSISISGMPNITSIMFLLDTSTPFDKGSV